MLYLKFYGLCGFFFLIQLNSLSWYFGSKTSSSRIKREICRIMKSEMKFILLPGSLLLEIHTTTEENLIFFDCDLSLFMDSYSYEPMPERWEWIMKQFQLFMFSPAGELKKHYSRRRIQEDQRRFYVTQYQLLGSELGKNLSYYSGFV